MLMLSVSNLLIKPNQVTLLDSLLWGKQDIPTHRYSSLHFRDKFQAAWLSASCPGNAFCGPEEESLLIACTTWWHLTGRERCPSKCIFWAYQRSEGVKVITNAVTVLYKVAKQSLALIEWDVSHGLFSFILLLPPSPSSTQHWGNIQLLQAKRF